MILILVLMNNLVHSQKSVNYYMAPFEPLATRIEIRYKLSAYELKVLVPPDTIKTLARKTQHGIVPPVHIKRVSWNKEKEAVIATFSQVQLGPIILLANNQQQISFNLTKQNTQHLTQHNCFPTLALRSMVNQNTFALSYLTKEQCKFNAIVSESKSYKRQIQEFSIKNQIKFIHRTIFYLMPNQNFTLNIQMEIGKQIITYQIPTTLVYVQNTGPQAQLMYPSNGTLSEIIKSSEYSPYIFPQSFQTPKPKLVLLYDHNLMTPDDYLGIINNWYTQSDYISLIPALSSDQTTNNFKSFYFGANFEENIEFKFQNKSLWVIGQLSKAQTAINSISSHLAEDLYPNVIIVQRLLCSEANGMCYARHHSTGYLKLIRQLKSRLNNEQIKAIFRNTQELNRERKLQHERPNQKIIYPEVRSLVKEMKVLDQSIKSLMRFATFIVEIWSLSGSILRYVIIRNTEIVSIVLGTLVVILLGTAVVFLKRRLKMQ